ncbi:MAG: hypothetical protein QOE83_546 [Actinomycetota bacterium]|nr:hypothetical protein [Actinomycetota bacterium]
MSALVAAPAVVLRAACVGKTCGSPDATQARVPFCPLPDRLKTLIAAGYRDGRSPDVLAVPSGGINDGVTGGTSPTTAGVPWPAANPPSDTSVPIVFTGLRVQHMPLPEGTGLDEIAPTLAGFLGFNRGHPEVRTGKPIVGVDAGGLTPSAPRLILELAWTGVSGTGLKTLPPSRTPWLRAQFRTGAGTFQGDTGSLPLDPAAVLTTIGTGGLPFQHGITGSLLRSPRRVVPAWGKGAPTSVIATLPDDFDQANGQSPKIALVAPAPEDQGLIGGTWYRIGRDKDLVKIGGNPTADVRTALATGLGSDATPDILGVVLQGTPKEMDRSSAAIERLAAQAAGGPASLITVTAGTGEQGASGSSGADIAAVVDRAVGARVVAATEPGGLFLDPAVQAQAHISGQDVVNALLPPAATSAGSPSHIAFADVFQGFAVSFRRYC